MCEAVCFNCENCENCEQYKNGCSGQSGTFYEEACPASEEYAGKGRCE